MKNTNKHTDKLKKPYRSSHGSRQGYTVRGRVWVEKDGELFLGWGRIQLLENIEKFGSISAAAKAMNLAYRNAWLWVEAMNRLSPEPLVEKATGGAGGGYARLTEAAHRAIRYYRELHDRLQTFIEENRYPEDM